MSMHFIVFGKSTGEHQGPSFKLEPTHFPLNNREEQGEQRADIQLLENSVCHLDTAFGLLQQ